MKGEQPAAGNSLFRAALYVRLSREDQGGGESESIHNQRHYLTAYAMRIGVHIAGVYADDGFTGTDLVRVR